jgi:hypothetical protein
MGQKNTGQTFTMRLVIGIGNLPHAASLPQYLGLERLYNPLLRG